MQIVRWTRFSAFLRSSSPQPRGQRTESCLGSFPEPGLSHSLVAYWLLLWSLPRAWMLTPVLLILLSRGYCHPSGKVPGPHLDRSVSWLWEGLPQHHPSTRSTEDPLQTHCLPSDLGLSVQSLAQRWELARPRVLKSWVICVRMEAAANQEGLSRNPSRLWLLPEDQSAGMGLAFSVMAGCLWDRIVSVLCV